jgi:cytidylate kinase
MLVLGSFEKAKRYIQEHSSHDVTRQYEHFPCITISRETGAGADVVSEKLVELLGEKKINDSPEWTIFDKNLIQKVLDDHHLPSYLDKYFQESTSSAVTSLISETLTGQPASWSLVSKTSQTIFKLARTGNVIIVEMGANFVTAKLRNAFHIRLIADYEDRVKHIEKVYNLNRKEAENFIKKDDEARRNFVEKNFHKKIDDPQYYHLVINTSLIPYDETARIICRIVDNRFKEYSSHGSNEGTTALL